MNNLIDLLESDDEEDDLFEPVFGKREQKEPSPRSTIDAIFPQSTQSGDCDGKKVQKSSTSASSKKTKCELPKVKEKEYKKLLGFCSFTIIRSAIGTGNIKAGDPVLLHREHTNALDRNYIRVDDLNANTIGHLGAYQGAHLAPVMDYMENKITFMSTILSNGSMHTNVHLKVELYAISNRILTEFETKPFVEGVKFHLKHFFQRVTAPKPERRTISLVPPAAVLSSSISTAPGIPAVAGLSSSTNPGEEAEKDIQEKDIQQAMAILSAKDLFETATNESEVEMATEIDWESQQEALDEMFEEQCKNKTQSLPQISMPEQFKNLTLYNHQKDGIQWLVHQERSDKAIPPFFKKVKAGSREVWYCEITQCQQMSPPRPIRGGILADDMGLGKTLQTLGLILSNPPKGHTYPFTKLGLGAKLNVPRCTLILCPLSVMANWSIEINKHVNGHVKDKFLKARIYHGPSRQGLLEEIKNGSVDVVMASYHTLAADLKKYATFLEECASTLQKKRKTRPETFIFNLEFHRIVLDEAHIIRSPKTGFFKAALMLNARHKLCLTGTPFVNRPEDIHSLLSFLGVEPLSHKSVFNRHVTEPIKARREVGLSTLRTTMAHVALRRNKAQVHSNIDLVEKTVQIRCVTMPEGKHKCVHDVLYQTARVTFVGLLRLGESEVLNNYMFFLELLLRVRQACCHADLVPIDRRARAVAVFDEIKSKGVESNLDPEEAEELLAKLQGTFEENALEECVVCLNEMEEESAIILRTCKHIFCQACLNQIRNHCCPLCRVSYTPDDMIKKDVAKAATSGKKPPKLDKSNFGRAPKVQAMLNAIEEMAPDEKGVIFSQWTSYLDIIEHELRSVGHTYTRIDGSMNMDERIEAMEAFDTERCDTVRYPRFILCSLHACGTGINLTRGNVVFMMDCWWNVAAENQAMDRVHRIGQKRPVRVMRFLVKDSIEERIVALQEAKSALGKGSLERLAPEEKRKARITTLKDLFEVGSVEQLWD